MKKRPAREKKVRGGRRRQRRAMLDWLNDCAERLSREGVTAPFRLVGPDGLSSAVFGSNFVNVWSADSPYHV